MKIIVVRHLATSWNEAGRLQGRRDEPISPLSDDVKERLTASLGTLIDGARIEDVVASNRIRTQQTAETFGYAAYRIDPNLDELDFGPFEGKLRADMLNDLGDGWTDRPGQLTLGEPVAVLAERVRRFVGSVSTCDTVLCFGHGAWMRALHSMALHDGDVNFMNQITIPNAGAMVVTAHDGALQSAQLHAL